MDFFFPREKRLRKPASSPQYALTRFYFCFSAGVGRSGAYIVIHSMVKRLHETGDINIFDFVAQIRQQRNHLVQEEVSA